MALRSNPCHSKTMHTHTLYTHKPHRHLVEIDCYKSSTIKKTTGCQTHLKLLYAQSLLLISTLFISHTVTQSLSNRLNCMPTESFFCDIKNFDTVQPFKNTLGHTTLEEARSSLHNSNDSDLPTKLLLPCRNICEEARECEPQLRGAMNSSWPSDWDCNKFEYYSDKHKMCVIDNQNERGIDLSSAHSSILPAPPSPPFAPTNKITHLNSHTSIISIVPPIPPRMVPDNISICDPGFFDCRLSDPKRPLCIEMKYVCDGKRDCYHSEVADPNDGSDEADCKEHCDDGQLYCDDKCIGRHDICNGKVDCSSGIDEQDCIDNLTGIIQSVLCIFVMMSAIYILIRFFRVVRDLEDKDQSYDTSRDESDMSHQTDTYVEHKVQNVITQKTYEQLLAPPIFQPQPPIPLHARLDEPSLHDCRQSFYQEPSILTTRSDAYERIIPGGYSGASSVYAFESNFDTSKSLTMPSAAPPTPPAPPPTPSFQCTRSNLYENIHD